MEIKNDIIYALSECWHDMQDFFNRVVSKPPLGTTIGSVRGILGPSWLSVCVHNEEGGRESLAQQSICSGHQWVFFLGVSS